MTKIFLLLVMFLATIPVCFTQGQGRLLAETRLEEFYLWDFGRVREGDVVKHNFNLKNSTGKTLKVKDVTTSCGCTASAVKKDTLLPGESTEIAVEFDSQGYSGPVRQFIYVHTDANSAPVLAGSDNGSPSTPLVNPPEPLKGHKRNIDNSIIKFIIKADVIK